MFRANNFLYFYLGPLKASIHKGLYIVLITLNVIMQIYTGWKKYQLRKAPIINHDETIKGTIKKTGIFTLFGITLIFMNLMLNSLFPNKDKNQNYFMSQDLISMFLTGVILPIIITATNPGMSKYIKLYISSTSIYQNGSKFLCCCYETIDALVLKRNNQIQPVE